MTRLTAVMVGVVVGAGVLVAVGASAPQRLIGSGQIRDGSILARDLSPAVRARLGAPGGAVTVTPAPLRVERVTGPDLLLGSGAVPFGTARADCPAGLVPTGGGFALIGDVAVTASRPDGGGWAVSARYVGPAFLQGRVAVTVVCLASG